MMVDVSILIKAVDQASAAIHKVSGGFKAFGENVKKSIPSMTSLNQGLEVAQKAAQLLGMAYDALVGNTMEYANTVRQMNRITGTSAEETSRLIQLTDDYNISLTDLETALRGAATKGIVVTTDSLAEMSDEYRNLATQTDKNTYLLEHFGRSGLEMAKVMEVGGDAIRSQSESISDNLVLTDEQVKKARELEIAQDNLNDTMAGLGVTIGNQVIPVMVDAANAFDLLLTAQDRYRASLDKHNGEVAETSKTYEEYRTEMVRAAKASGLWQEAVMKSGFPPGTVGSIQDAERAIGLLTEEEYNYARASEQSKAEAEHWARITEQAGVTAEEAAPKIEAMASGYDAAADRAQRSADAAHSMGQATLDLLSAQDALKEAEAAWKEGEAGDIAGMLEQRVGSGQRYADGLKIIDEVMGTNLATEQQLNDAQQLLVNQYASGQISADQFREGLQNLNDTFMPLDENIIKATDHVKILKGELENLARVWWITVRLRNETPFDIGGDADTSNSDDLIERRFATGGSMTVPPGYPNDSYRIGVSSGERVIVIPQGRQSAGAGVTIGSLNLYGVQNARQLLDELGKLTKSSYAAGGGYAGG